MSKKHRDIIIGGFALFAIFFGAGNLIFPPYLGLISGQNWPQAALGFLLSDPIIPILGVVVTASLGGRATDLGKHLSLNFSKILGAISILLIGPFFSVPRTGATVHEILVQGLNPAIPNWLTALVFFGITYLLCLNPSQVIDKIGKYLTPGLLLLTFIIVVKALLVPSPDLLTDLPSDLFVRSFKEGYQTMDGIGSPLMAGIVLTSLIQSGYHKQKDQHRMILAISFVAFVLLATVYGGLIYTGAKFSGQINLDQDRIPILTSLIAQLFGRSGQIIMALMVSLACLTTAVGLTSTCGQYFAELSQNKLSYRTVVSLAILVELFLSLLGVDALISIAVPILTGIYPIVISLILWSIFDKQIKYKSTYLGAVVGAGLISISQAFVLVNQMNGNHALDTLGDALGQLPLSQFGFEWLLPSLIFSIICTLFSQVKKNKNL